MADWGSGSLLKSISSNLTLDIPIRQLMKSDPDIITFSGDKLIGGPSVGYNCGEKNVINFLQKILFTVLFALIN